MTYEELWHPLTKIYESGEAKAIVRLILELRYGLSPADIYCGKVNQIPNESINDMQIIMQRLLKSEPVQYVLGQAEFCNRMFYVQPGVLIPRQETEDMVEMVLNTTPGKNILDIGTGSGCIAITLALHFITAYVEAWDINNTALKVAHDNAIKLGAKVIFRKINMLFPPKDNEKWDIIVSNPPYITPQESCNILPNVLNYEPHEALFVPQENPLIFHNAILSYAIKALRKGGLLCFEINPMFNNEIVSLSRDMGFTKVSIKKDRFQKERFIIMSKE